MSAFVVSNEHIRYIVEGARRLPCMEHSNQPFTWRSRWDAPRHDRALIDPQQVGQMLLHTNRLAVRERYPDSEPDFTPYVHHPYPDDWVPDPLQLIKAVCCLDYQSCELTGWRKTEAFSFLMTVLTRAVGHLRGWDDVAWAIDEPRSRAKM